ncbi:hypothetical protein BDV95DRAFT_332087 [Massariosphaeria phaeospora]|uniref:Uncharacterized protein n=1 Tax=Massariosphaeria phaeospora TaxID=100035 RepID=A0A7C8IHL8_9PLEO|nr:hypothetical protein BDV95DRAFT_332087 [Massariosphaeria phaeospora]
MCFTEHVYHQSCRHWGRERFVGEPCPRSRIVDGRHTGCSYVENLGSTNSKDYCFNCRYLETQGGSWRPFANVSTEAWAKVEEKNLKREANRFAHARNSTRRWYGYWRRWWPSRSCGW